MRGHTRFQWKTPEKPLAKGMDCLDFQAARGFDRAGEELAGGSQPGGIRHLPLDPGNFIAKRVIGHQRPVAEALVKPGRHFGGGGLGESETENAMRIAAREEQPGHAGAQGVCLSRAGIGGNPDRSSRMRCAALRVVGSVCGFRRGRHSPSPPAADHSFTRARWS